MGSRTCDFANADAKLMTLECGQQKLGDLSSTIYDNF